MPPQFTRPRKFSIMIAGHRTSITLEPEFMQALRDIATQKKISLPELVKSIDESKGPASLSSALRVYALHYYKNRR